MAETLELIRSEAESMIELAQRDPARRVPQYPEWTMSELMAHTGSILGRTAMVCRRRLQERPHAPRLPDGVHAVAWFTDQLGDMLDVLTSADPTTTVWGFGSAPSVGFWTRRMLIEVGLHRYDAAAAWGVPGPLLDEVALAGLEEFDDMWLPRLSAVSTLRIRDEDSGRTWLYGAGVADSEVSGTASELYLRLMSRPSPVVLPSDWSDAVAALTPPSR